MWGGENVYVIHTDDVDRLRTFLEGFGLSFVREQHDLKSAKKGAVHYACQVGERVLEIYPEKK